MTDDNVRSGGCLEDTPCTESGVPRLLIPDSDRSAISGLQKQLEVANAQLIANARELRKVVESDRECSRALLETNRMLRDFASDLKGALAREQEKSRHLEHAYTGTVRRLIQASWLGEDETSLHLWRVSSYSWLLAAELGWKKSELDLIQEAAALHDIGKIGIPGAILRKQGPLDPEEWRLVKQHPGLGGRLLESSGSPLLAMAEQIALTHHERWDGSGYPAGLKGAQIPMAGHIVMLADQYDVLRSDRPYKRAFDHSTTCSIILDGDGKTMPEHFAPQLLCVFERIHEKLDRVWNRHSSSAEQGVPVFELEQCDAPSAGDSEPSHGGENSSELIL